MIRLVLAAALATSLIVPVGSFALLAAVDTSSTGSTSTPTEWDRDEIIDLYNELAKVDAQASPRSPGHVAEARRIAREASAWATRFEAEPEWEEFASATGAMAVVLADTIADPSSVPESTWDRTGARLERATHALPPERQPE